jgi:hypothetical protein
LVGKVDFKKTGGSNSAANACWVRLGLPEGCCPKSTSIKGRLLFSLPIIVLGYTQQLANFLI